jgi:hypothetical protein
MKVKLTRLIPFAALVCIVLASCKKNDAVSPTQPNAQSARTTNMISTMQDESDNEIADAFSADLSTTACPMVTFDPSRDVYPHTKVVDYGTGCTDEFGVTRSGKRFVTQYADYRTAPAGAVINVVTFSNYYLNGVSISGSSRISVVTPAVPGPFTVRILESKTITDGSSTRSYVSTTDRMLVAGDVNSPKEDKSYQIVSTAYGTEVIGDSTMSVWKLTTVPSKPVYKQGDCLYRTKGAVKVTLNQGGVTTNEVLDYGDGTCDDQATLSIDGGAAEPVTLPLPIFPSN